MKKRLIEYVLPLAQIFEASVWDKIIYRGQLHIIGSSHGFAF